MAITKQSYRKWNDAYQIISGDARLNIVTEVGPRALSLTLGRGPNLLFDDVDEVIADDDWKIIGGHRFWVAPETAATYAGDIVTNCEATIDGDTLRITAPPDEATGFQKSLAVSPAPGGFRLVHTLSNVGGVLTPPGSIWALTCMRPVGKCAIPWIHGTKDWRLASIQYWDKWMDHGSDIESKQWVETSDLFEIHPTGEEGKVGSATTGGWVGQWSDDATFIKQFTPQRGGQYPDGGCTIELYTCEYFIELETLSPLATLAPGESISHEERWFVSKPIEMTAAAVDALIR